MNFEREGVEFFRSTRADGLCGFALGRLAHGRDVNGSTLRCGLLTKGLAKLAVASGVRHIEATRATAQGRDFLNRHATSLRCEGLSDTPDNSDQIERALLPEARQDDGSAFLDVIAAKTLEMLEHHIVPTDELLTSAFDYRLGWGGGGT